MVASQPSFLRFGRFEPWSFALPLFSCCSFRSCTRASRLSVPHTPPCVASPVLILDLRSILALKPWSSKHAHVHFSTAVFCFGRVGSNSHHRTCKSDHVTPANARFQSYDVIERAGAWPPTVTPSSFISSFRSCRVFTQPWPSFHPHAPTRCKQLWRSRRRQNTLSCGARSAR